MKISKHTYLKNDVVVGFVEYLSKLLSGDLLAHSYRDRRSGVDYSFKNLGDAYQSYHWNGDNFEETHNTLQIISRLIRSYEERENNSTIDHELKILQGCATLMSWGGTEKGNCGTLAKWSMSPGGLSGYLKKCEATLCGDEFISKVSHFGNGGISSNAGFTKIYSLKFDNFVIYDSRVAAAIGWLVVKYCQASGRHTRVPSELAFFRMSSMQGANDPTNRNPSKGDFQFALIGGNSNSAHMNHARSNILSNWILVAALEKAISLNADKDDHDKSSENVFIRLNKASGFQVALRAVESALFMVGYDLGATDC